jgi:hypothetical protein
LKETADRPERRQMMETSLETSLLANRDKSYLKPIGNPEKYVILEKWDFQEILKQIAVSTKAKAPPEQKRLKRHAVS